jgi:putative oxidoreductase
MASPKLTRAAEVIAALLLMLAAVTKFLGDPATIEVFATLNMEPGGRYLIAFIELTAALLLLSAHAALGSLLAVAVMIGAIIAHVTQLGLVVGDDGGLHVGMLAVVLVCACYALYARRKEIPLVGETL